MNAVRACWLCEQEYTPNVRGLVEVFKLCRLEVPELLRLRDVTRSWGLAAQGCIADMGRLLTLLPTHVFTDEERQLLWVNRRHLCGHSRWMVQLMKAVEWDSGSAAEEVLQLLSGPGVITCEDLGCDAGCCKPELTPDDALELLSGAMPISHRQVWRPESVATRDTGTTAKSTAQPPQLPQVHTRQNNT